MSLKFSPQTYRLLKKINFRIKTGQYEQAIELLENGPSDLSDSKQAKISLAQLYTLTENYQAAIKTLRRSFADDPDPHVAGLLALLLYSEGRYEEILSIAERAGEDTNLRFAEAMAHIELGRDLKRSEMILKELARDDPRFSPYLFQVEILRGKFAQAQNTLKSFTEDIVAFYNSAVIDLRLVLPSNAKRSFAKAEDLVNQVEMEKLYSKWKIFGYEKIDLETFQRKLTYLLTLGRTLTLSNPHIAYETLQKMEKMPEADHYLHLSLASLATKIGKGEDIVKKHVRTALRFTSEIPADFQKFLEVDE